MSIKSFFIGFVMLLLVAVGLIAVLANQLLSSRAPRLALLTLSVLSVSCFLIMLGAAIVRVGIKGQYLDRAGLVSYVKRRSDQPRQIHRIVTIALGAVSCASGFGFITAVLTFKGR